MQTGVNEGGQPAASRRRAWFRLTVGVGLMIVAVVGMILASRARQAGLPHAAVDREVIDLGDQPYGTRVRAEFKISNTGQGGLEFTSPPEIEVVEGC
jgi:hypothetical protein